MLGRAAASCLVFLAIAGHEVGAQPSSTPDGFEVVQASFDTKLDLDTRLFFQNAMIAAGYLNAVPTERFSLRLFNGIKRLQTEHGLPSTGVVDTRTVDLLFGRAVPKFREWQLQRVSHPTRNVSIIMPTGMGLTRRVTGFGIAYGEPEGPINAHLRHIPGKDAAATYAELLRKYKIEGVKINYHVLKNDWFVVSTTSVSGTDGYLRYHSDGDGVTGFALFWNNAKGDVSAERIAILMSASLNARMTGAPFSDPPSPNVVEASVPNRVPDQRASPPVSPPTAPEPGKISAGTGFFVGANGDLVTNAHVVQSCTTITVRTHDQSVRSARLLAKDEANDLALLRVDAQPRKVAQLRPSARLGEDVAAFGFPHSDLFASSGNFTLGNVTATSGLQDDTRYFQVSAPIHSGNSGGPLLDERGNVVGVVTAKLNTKLVERRGDSAQNVNFAIKGGLLTTFLDGNSTAFVSSGIDGAKMERADLAEHARQISAHVTCR